MKTRLLCVWCASMLAWVGRPQAASAGVPGWCNGKTYEVSDYELRQLQDNSDPEKLMESLAKASCSASAEAEAHRGEIDAARAAWGKKYGLADADWAEAVAYAEDSGHNFFHGDFSTKNIADFTPVDQYRLIVNAWADDSRDRDPLYYTDVLDAKLSESGRVGFLMWCIDRAVTGQDRDVVKWALCQGDVDKFDANKVFAELHADTQHDGSSKFSIRLHAVALRDRLLKELADDKAKLIKKDDEYGKIFAVAKKGREDWAKTIGTNTKLLELVARMDAGTGFHSRKLFDGCEPETAKALADAISTIPAKSFSGMNDVRDDPYAGFAKKAKDVLAKSPAVSVAAIAYSECQPNSGLGKYVASIIYGTPSSRGPRDHALAAIMGSEFKFDDMNKKHLDFPRIGSRQWPGGDQTGSAGGVVKSVKPDKDGVVVALEKLVVMQEDCVQEHSSNRVSRIRGDGTLEYDSICDKWSMVAHDHTWTDFHMSKGSEKWLKPGVMFSANYGEKTADVLATWANKSAKLPNMVLGATIK